MIEINWVFGCFMLCMSEMKKNKKFNTNILFTEQLWEFIIKKQTKKDLFCISFFMYFTLSSICSDTAEQ